MVYFIGLIHQNMVKVICYVPFDCFLFLKAIHIQCCKETEGEQQASQCSSVEEWDTEEELEVHFL